MTQPQILPDSQFGRILTELASRSKRIVEIGGGTGLGSTLCLANGATSSDQEMVTVEADPNNYTVLRNNVSPNVLTLRGVISRAIKPYWHPQNLVQHRETWAAEAELAKSATYVGDHYFIGTTDPIDLLLLDGGEFCSDSDFLHLWQYAKIIALDDTNANKAVKNSYAVQCLIRNDWKILHFNNEDRNGWAVFERPDKLISSNPK